MLKTTTLVVILEVEYDDEQETLAQVHCHVGRQVEVMETEIGNCQTKALYEHEM